MNIESKLWKLRAYVPHSIAVIQKATGTVRYVTASHLPELNEIAMMTEARFDAICRAVFHGEAWR